MNNKVVAIIPSRFGSSRFPGKPLAEILGKPMIQWVYDRVLFSHLFDTVFVATDDQRIFDKVKDFGGEVIMTSPNHACGTDRILECVNILKLDDEDIVINVQGDEPLIRKEILEDLLKCFREENVYMCTLKKRIDTEDEFNNPNVVKVISDANDFAIYFSRFCVPYERNNKATHYKHIGLYGYKVWFLKKFGSMQKSNLEMAESLEQLRAIENGYKIKVVETNYQTIGVDTPEQLKEVEKRMVEENA